MLFTSYGFIGFIAVLLIAYYLVPRRAQAPLLLLASFAFYAFSGWENLLFIAGTILTVWAGGLLLGQNFARQKALLAAGEMDPGSKKAIRDKQKKKRKGIVAAVLLFNLAVLAVVKYASFAIGIVNAFGAALRTPSDWIVPMGISFYTFQSIGYLVDVYRGTVPAQKNPWKFALFVSFFPQLVQGPISRYGDLSKTLFDPHPFRLSALRRGLERVLWGYFKKLVIADRLSVAVVAITGGQDRGGYALALLFLYTVQLYADFTGGIDITIGLAEALGITVAENFHRPYCAVSLKDYWRRWHISMCTWFRDYLFYPVSTSRFMRSVTKGAKKLFGDKAGRKVPLYLSSFIVWGATGLWHGANWNFLTWGLMNWLILMISQECEGLYERFHKHVLAPRRIDWVKWGDVIPVNKRSIGVCILLSLVTFGIYQIYWKYLLVKNIRAIQKSEKSCTGEMLCLVFVPYYPLYWWFTRGKTVKDTFAEHGYSATGSGIAYLILGIFGLDIVSMAIMQNDFNSLKTESTQFVQQSTHVFKARGKTWRVLAVLRTFLLVAVLNLFDCYPTLGGTFGAFFSIFNPAAWSGFSPAGLLELGLSAADYIAAGIAAVLMFGVSLLGARGDVRTRLEQKPFALRLVLILLLFFAVLVFGAYGKQYDASQFIYNRF